MYLKMKLKSEPDPVEIIHNEEIVIENNLFILRLPDEDLAWQLDDIISITITRDVVCEAKVDWIEIQPGLYMDKRTIFERLKELDEKKREAEDFFKVDEEI